MTPFLAIVRVTIRQTLGVKRAIGLGLLSLSAAGTYFLTALGQGAGRHPNAAFDVFLGLSVGTFLNIIIPVVTLIIATSVLGDERRDTTMSFLVLRPLKRITIAAAKVTAAILESFFLTGVGALALGIVSAPRLGTTAYIVPLLVGTLVATAAYCAVFVPIGYLLKRATLIGLTYVFVWENGIGGAIPALAGISPWRIGISAMAAIAPSDFVTQLPQFAIGDLQPGAAGAALKALILITLSSVALASILRRRDLAV